MKTLQITLILLIFAIGGFGQTTPERRVIEVSGSAETLVTPDTFTFKITIAERMDRKDKITIEQQETALRAELAKIGIDSAKDLSVYDLSSNYIPQKNVRDVLGRKDYRLKIRDIGKIMPLVELTDRLNISRLELLNTEHSEIERIRRETKIEAMKAAKDKADYLLEAIGSKTGKPIFIKEIEQRGNITGNITLDGVSSNTMSNYVSTRPRTDTEPEADLSFAQIRIRFVIDAKFEIE